MTAASHIDQIAAKVERLLGAERALSRLDAASPYASDASGLGPVVPDVVALVDSAEEIAEVLRLALLDRIPITPRGLGSGKSGGALAVEGGIVVSTERMRRIKEIDAGDLVAVVEPGVITGRLQAEVEAERLFYPPDPASLDICSIGGNVAENAGGPRAFKYGVTRDHTLAMEIAMIGGQRLRVGHRAPKGVTGLDLVGLMVGSEGTLALITEVTLRLRPRPAAVATFVACFADAAAAVGAVRLMVGGGHRPRAIELLDRRVVEHLLAAGVSSLLPGSGAALLVELDAEEEASGGGTLLDRSLLDAANRCEQGGATEVFVARDEAERKRLWDARREVSQVLRDAHRHKLSEDIAVPPSALPAMIERLDELSVEAKVVIAAYGHAGDGNLHVNVLWDDDRDRGALEPLRGQVFEAALELGGTLSGEHGIGLTKRGFLHLEQPEPLLALQRELKRAFDPLNLMNPGKLL